MNDTLKILNPKKQVATREGLVDVKELSWREAIGFLEKLSKHVGQFIAPDGRLNINFEQLPSVIVQSSELIDYIVTKATGKDAAWLETQSPEDVLAILDAAIELNASPELFTRGKTLAGRLKAVFGGQTGATSTNNLQSVATS